MLWTTSLVLQLRGYFVFLYYWSAKISRILEKKLEKDGNLRVLSVTRFSRAHLVLVGETDAKYSEQIAIGGFDIDVGLDEGLPFLDHRTKLVGRQVHTVKVGKNRAALNIFGDQAELTERSFRIVVALKIREGHLENTELQTLGSDLCNFH